MKKLVLVLAILSICSVGHATEDIKIRVTNFPPQFFKDSSGHWTGLEVELARAVVLQAGLKPVCMEVNWDAALVHLDSGMIHMLLNVSRTPEREKRYRWIGPERQATVGLVVRKKHLNLPIKTIDDLVVVAKQEKINFGILDGAFYSEAFNSRLKNPQFCQYFEVVNKSALNFDKLRAGRILGFFEDTYSSAYKIKHTPGLEDLALHDFFMNQEPVYFAVSPRLPKELFQRLVKAFAELETKGALEKIRHRAW